MAQQPNILLITTDQQRWDSLSIYGSPGYRTPNLDRLCQDGVYFDRAYTPSPVCTPARVSILTGLYPTTHGSYEIGMEPVPALRQPTLGTHLTDAGYSTALIGKTHFVARCLEPQHVAGNDSPDADGEEPDEQFWEDFTGPYVGFQYVQHCAGHTSDRLPAASYRAWLNRKGENLDQLHEEQNADGERSKRIPDGPWQIDPGLTQTAWITEKSIAFIDRNTSGDKPWFCWASYQDPHPPFVCPEPYYSDVDMRGVDLGGFKEGEWDDKPTLYRRFADGHYWSDTTAEDFIDPDCPAKNIPAMGRGDGPAPVEKVQAYIGMCNMLDDYIGRLLSALDARGLRDNTLIIFTTDHGEMLGRHGLWGKGIAAYDDQQRIPAIISWPAAQDGPVGRTSSAMNLVDIMPTCLDAAGVAIPPLVQGISQLPIIRGETQMLRDWSLVDFMATVKLHQQTLVSDNWKLVVYEHAEYGELYDLSRDPDQYRNLFDLPEGSEMKLKMLQKLAQVNMQTAGKMPRRISNA